MKTYLNLGCGQCFVPSWTNVDFRSTGPGVIAHNLLEGIPFPDSSFDVVYHSHVMEHLPKRLGRWFLLECQRVLRPGGVVRIAVPDLERIAQEYLRALNEAANGSPDGPPNYDWMMLELYDQVVRDASRGEMGQYLTSGKVTNRSFVLARCGSEVRPLLEQKPAKPLNLQSRFFGRWRGLFRKSSYRNKLLQWVIGDDAEALRIGRFRLSGEIHQWMYDRYSLGRLLQECGFTDVCRRQATESYVADWAGFNLDTEADGSVRKPDSLFMEGNKTS